MTISRLAPRRAPSRADCLRRPTRSGNAARMARRRLSSDRRSPLESSFTLTERATRSSWSAALNHRRRNLPRAPIDAHGGGPPPPLLVASSKSCRRTSRSLDFVGRRSRRARTVPRASVDVAPFGEHGGEQATLTHHAARRRVEDQLREPRRRPQTAPFCRPSSVSSPASSDAPSRKRSCSAPSIAAGRRRIEPYRLVADERPPRRAARAPYRPDRRA